MPSEHVVAVVQDVQLDVQQSQTKFCSLCHTALSDAAAPVLHPLADALICAPCRDRIRAARQPHLSNTDQRSYRLLQSDGPPNNVYQQLRAHNTMHEAPVMQHTRRYPQDISQVSPISQQQELQQSIAATTLTYCHVPSAVSAPPTTHKLYPQQLQPLTIGSPPCASGSSALASATSNARTSSIVSPATYHPSTSTVVQHRRPHTLAQSGYGPLVDITRLRVRSQSHHCLYPGATFGGTQKSGRNSYDVNVTIVVCPSHYLCPLFDGTSLFLRMWIFRCRPCVATCEFGD